MQNKYSLYDDWHEVKYIQRKNRFVMEFDDDDGTIAAYVPNTGRMTEFRFPGRPFYLAPVKSKKFNYRLVATKYQNSYVILDTIKVNDIFQELLEQKVIEEFRGIDSIRREFTIANSRFDFLLTTKQDEKILVEIKSCTLCHNGVAMFPDAPTSRGRKHIRQLHQLAEKGYETYIYYLVLNNNAEYFVPDFHIDYEYGQTFQKASNVNFRALKLDIDSPVSIAIQNTREIPVKDGLVDEHCTRKGSYVLILKNGEETEYEIGALGKLDFKKGYYVYVGSAMNNLDKRIKRHKRKRKSKHWHIDYLTSGAMDIVKAYKIRRSDPIESKLSNRIEKLADTSIDEFGASDAKELSHLHYFVDNPIKNSDFYQIILDFMTSMAA